MEKNSTRISRGTAVCIFIIIVLIIALGIVYYIGFIRNNEEFANGVNENNVKDNQIDVAANSFREYQENYKTSYKKIIAGENVISIYPRGEVPGVCEIYLDSNNDVYFRFEEDSQLYKKYGKTYKVESNVANIYLCPVGTGGYADAVFLMLDGTASSVSGYELEQNPVVECNKIEGVEKAVNVITYAYVLYNDYGELGANGPATVFIDINGNWIGLYEKSNDTKIDSNEEVDIVKSKSYGEPLPLEGVAFVKDGYLYYSYSNSEEPEKIKGVSNIKSLKIFNIGTGINRVPFVVTEDGIVYRLNSAKQLVVYEELSNYKVDKIISHEGEMYDVFTLLLLDGTTKVVEVKE